VYLTHLSTLQFLTYAAFLCIAVWAVARLLPGRAPPVREEPYPDSELHEHDRKLAKYFIGGAGFLVLGSVHMVLKNLPWTAEWLAGAGYAGHLVADLSNTHVMIVGGGTLIATGLCWYALPRIVGRPLASNGLAQAAFWLTAAGLLIFYVALIGNGIAMGRLMSHGMDYPRAKAAMGNAYRVPVGIGAGIMGMGYWCFAANVLLTVFQARLVRVAKPDAHLWKFLATGAAALTVGTVQGVIQVQPANADWLYRAQHAGEWIDPISHAHVNLVTGLTMLAAGALLYMVPLLGGTPPSRRLANRCFYALLAGSLAFYGVALYLGFHEGRMVVRGGLTPLQAEAATPLHPYLIMAAGVAMLGAFWLLLWVFARSVWNARGAMARPFVLAGCAALLVGTFQGPVQAFPAVNHLIHRGDEAGDVIVNLHAQLNMIGGLMVILVGLALVLLVRLTGVAPPARSVRRVVTAVPLGMAIYYAAGISYSLLEAHAVTGGTSYRDAVAGLEPLPAIVMVPAALAVLAGFAAYGSAAWRMTARYRSAGRLSLRGAPAAYAGRIPRRVRRQRPAAVAAWEVPLGLLGFPGVGWLFAGFPLAATVVLIAGPALAWAAIPLAFSPFGNGPLRAVGWRAEFVWLPLSTIVSATLLYRAHRRRLVALDGPRPRSRLRRRAAGGHTRVAAGAGALALLVVSLPFVAAVGGLGGTSVRYAYQPTLTREITGQFLTTPRGTVKLFAWRDPQERYPADALRVHASDVRGLRIRAAAVDSPGAYRLFRLGNGSTVPLRVEQRTATTLALAPAQALAAGRYLLIATHEGMFGGRDFSYMTVVPPGAPVTPIGGGSSRGAPAIADTLLPLTAAFVALLFSLMLARSYRRRPAGEKLLWAGGLVLFAVAAASEAAAQGSGWTDGLFRAYYLAGGVLTVVWLGAGSAWLQMSRRWRDVLTGALVVASLAAAAAVLLAPVHHDALAAAHSGRPPANAALGGHAFVWAIVLNSLGTLALVGGALLSVARRTRVRANLWIGAGALVLALSTSMSRAGDYSLMYLGELVGIAFMFLGFQLAGARRPPATAPSPRPAGRAIGALAAK
jgi:cytochrome c oxidase cbb3-type subunit 1